MHHKYCFEILNAILILIPNTANIANSTMIMIVHSTIIVVL